MSNNLEKTLLGDGVDLLLSKARITTEIKTELDNFIDNISDLYVAELTYDDFNQVSSTGITFTAATRRATGGTGGGTLIIPLDKDNIIIKSINFDVIIQTGMTVNFSKDAGVTWYTISNYMNMCEELVDGEDFWIKITIPEAFYLTKVWVNYKQA